MRPKNPSPKNTGAPHSPLETSPLLSTPRLELPGGLRPDAPPPHQPEPRLPTLPPSSETLPSVRIQDLVSTPRDGEHIPSSNPHPTDSIRHYELSPQTRTLLPGANTEGLRVHRGRIYAEVQYTTTTTVMVDWDEGSGTYRAKLPQEMHPSGPALRFDPQSNTWRVGEPPYTGDMIGPVVHRQADNPDGIPAQGLAPRTQSDMTAVYIDTRNYVWNNDITNHHGYVVMHRKMRRGDAVGPPSHHAFMDENGSYVIVEAPTYAIDRPAELLPAWTDRDIWDLYGLQGADITRFRTEAERTGKKPQWARVRAQRMENTHLFDELHRWSGREMDRDMFIRLLEHQKRTPAEWAKHLDSVTLHRSTPDPQSPLPRVPTPETPALQTPSPRPPTPDITEATPGYGHQSYYTWDIDNQNFHGYVEMQRKPGLDDSHGPLTQVAFPEGSGLTIVSPIRYSPNQRAFRPYWRDIDIWNLYRIEGADILRFRQDVALHLKQPAWVKQRELSSRREELLEYLRLWTNPDSPLKSREQVIARFQPYNLSTLQLARLCNELSPTGQFNKLINDELPGWVHSHQAKTLVVTNTKQLDPFLSELHAEIIRLRNQGEGTSLMKDSLTPPFFRELLLHSGFKRNRHNYLYRLDIPAVFKVDNRTPFEIARPGAMAAPTLSIEGSTSETAVSAMFSLRAAMKFANESNDATGSLDTRTDSPLTGSEPRQTNGAASLFRSRRMTFCYLLDTRNVEVVSGQDNRAYNPTRIDKRPADDQTRFPSMKMEGHVSMSSIGFTSRRVWLVNSDMTRAATVDDINTQALEHATGSNQSQAEVIEARTQAGELNRGEYDALIDEVAKAGKRTIEMPAGQDVFSTDIIFPPELISLL